MSVASTMPKQQINIKLDLQKGWLNQKAITLKQGDHLSRVFVIRVANTFPLNLTGCQPYLFVKQPDGEVLSKSCEMINASQGEFMVRLSSEMLKTNGTVSAEVVISKGGEGTLSFPHFAYTVEESLHDEVANEVTEEFGILWELIHETETSLVEMENRFGNFTQEKENEFQLAEAQRQANEIVRQQTYTQMKNTVNQVYNTTLKYRIIE